jgi:hypothetical protein
MAKNLWSYLDALMAWSAFAEFYDPALFGKPRSVLAEVDAFFLDGLVQTSP